MLQQVLLQGAQSSLDTIPSPSMRNIFNTLVQGGYVKILTDV